MSILESPVTTASDVVFTGGVVPEPQTAKIYTCSQADPERIEAIYARVDFPTNASIKDVFSVQLVDQSGVVLYEQATPPLLAVDSASLVAFLCWSRAGNDTAQLAAFEQLFANDAVRRAWVNMRLPDLVLQPQSYVNLLLWTDDGGESGTVPVTQIAITVTRDAGAGSTTTLADIAPLLSPTDATVI